MTPDIQELIAELEEAERAATPGPWWVPTLADSYVHANTREVARCYASPDTRGTLPGANARLIALMRTHLPTLLEAVKRQGEELSVLRRLAPEYFRWTGGPDQTEDPEWACDKIKYGGAHFENEGTPDVRFVVYDAEDRRWVAEPGDYIVRAGDGLRVLPARAALKETTGG